jgi:hypothetical protein
MDKRREREYRSEKQDEKEHAIYGATGIVDNKEPPHRLNQYIQRPS